MPTKRIASGLYPANTVEINRALANVDTFSEEIITEGGFELTSVTLRGARQKTKTHVPRELPNGYSFTVSHETSDVYLLPAITTDIVATMKAIAATDSLAAITIREIHMKKGNDTYYFKVIGGRKKEALFMERNGVAHYDIDFDELQKDLAGLFNRQCYFTSNLNSVPAACDPSKTV